MAPSSMKTLDEFKIDNIKEYFHWWDLVEGRKTVGAIKGIALFLKRKVINSSKNVKSESDTNKKIDLLSSQMNALASLMVLNIAMEDEGDSLFSKGIIASGLVTEENSNNKEDHL